MHEVHMFFPWEFAVSIILLARSHNFYVEVHFLTMWQFAIAELEGAEPKWRSELLRGTLQASISRPQWDRGIMCSPVMRLIDYQRFHLRHVAHREVHRVGVKSPHHRELWRTAGLARARVRILPRGSSELLLAMCCEGDFIREVHRAPIGSPPCLELTRCPCVRPSPTPLLLEKISGSSI